MKRKKRQRKQPKTAGVKNSVFCTECGIQLENFCFSSRADDIVAIRKTLAQCKKTGKFAGEFCAKLFIVEPVDLRTMLDESQDKTPLA